MGPRPSKPKTLVRVQPGVPDFTGRLANGKPPVSETGLRGSIPRLPASSTISPRSCELTGAEDATWGKQSCLQAGIRAGFRLCDRSAQKAGRNAGLQARLLAHL